MLTLLGVSCFQIERKGKKREGETKAKIVRSSAILFVIYRWQLFNTYHNNCFNIVRVTRMLTEIIHERNI